MRRIVISMLASCLALLALQIPATAAELTGAESKASAKKIFLTFNLSETLDSEKIYDYSANIVRIKIAGLELKSSLLKGDKLKVQDEHGNHFYRFTRYSKTDDGAMISIYLGKLCSPADALVIPKDGRIEVEIIKPLWKLENEPVVAEPAADTKPVADTSTDETGNESVEESPAIDTSSPEVKPEVDLSSPSYRKFDLDKVPASMVEIKGIPFDEALLLIVAESGFNVVVGNGIDDTEVNLNFTKKGISLESALDILCMAYELKYTVDDDAIIISLR